MDTDLWSTSKYPTRDCGKQIDEGDFYQVLRQKEDDGSLTDSSERLLNAGRTYIAQETSSVWRNAEVSILGPDDQIVFVSGTQVNRFVITLDEKNKVITYCKEKSWSCNRDTVTGSRTTSTLRTFFSKIRSYKDKEAATNVTNSTPLTAVEKSRVYMNGKTNHSIYDNTEDGNEDYYSADEYTTFKQRSAPKHESKPPAMTSWVPSWKNSIAKNTKVTSALYVVIGIFHMVKLMLIAYWQIVKCILKSMTYR